MDVILLERIGKMGGIGDVVTVKPGYARNFLIPQGKALRANDVNRARFEIERDQIVARNESRKADASEVAGSLDGKTIIVVRSAGETGQLYGSVAARDIAELLQAEGFKVARNQVNLNQPIKKIGMHEVPIQLHAEVEVTVTMNVARSEDEATRQAAGEDLTSADAIYGEMDEDDQVTPDEFFDEEAQDDRAGFVDEEGAEVDPAEADQPYV